MKEFAIIGLSYKKADTNIRSKYSFSSLNIEKLVSEAKAVGINNFFILSTCNRTEFYLENHNHSKELIKIYLKFIENGTLEEFNNYFVTKTGDEAINHFFRVCSGVESQILGDFEIIYQIKIWFKYFKNAGTVNAKLERLINTGIELSKQIKHETSLSSGISSVSYAAVHYILNNVSELKDKRILLFGLGKIGLNTCKNLVKHIDKDQIKIINRTEKKSIEISKQFSIETQPIEKLQIELNNCDILIVATGSIDYTIKKEFLLNRKKELLILDLSIPNNVEEGINKLENTQVINVDVLSTIINNSLSKRKNDIPKAESIIKEKIEEYYLWLSLREFAPLIQNFKNELDGLKNHLSKEVAKKKIITKEETQENHLLSDKLIQKLTNRFASYILQNQSDAENTLSLINKVFVLDKEHI
ncbi:MAG: glutamyl-tRNA reductase [Solirubrobacteraceae bacterium]